ncbi:hypothetical protein BRADI_1g14495v3 [Brachypodium distachyon]|uniref:TF-B3 domain-containing protein n=2 Tax=Brachypodium distachyon TaxID=15368 RepID=A0A0Q3RMG9_BRADI|nr:hypothetical protein BRADI_1g14495v3 [Brachypodium distachyon]
MRKPCEGSKEKGVGGDAQKRASCFFKVMIGDFHERITIPDAFVKRFSGKFASNIKLESPNGCTFDVQVKISFDELVIESGWNAFVSAHDLKMGDFLTFKYDGISEMKVLIFDPSGCEKTLPCLPMKNATHGQEPDDIASHFHDTPMNSPQTEISNQGNNTVDISSSSSPSRSSGYVSSSEDDLESLSPKRLILCGRTRPTGSQKKRLKEKIQAIHSEIPIYGCVIRKSSIQGTPCTMEICRKYADLYLPFEDETMKFRRDGKRWYVRCCISNSYQAKSAKRLKKGWREFAHDNNLQLGDICLFKLLKKKKYTMGSSKEKEYTMDVHIIRK